MTLAASIAVCRGTFVLEAALFGKLGKTLGLLHRLLSGIEQILQ